MTRLAFALVTAAVLGAGPPPPAIPFPLLPTGVFSIVPGESWVRFFVPDNRGGFTGETTAVTGRVTVTPQGSAEYIARVDASIDARALTTRNALRDATMRALYLRTAQYSTIAFLGTATAAPGLGIRPFAAAVRGQVTIRGVTREEAFSATVVALADEYLADATTEIRMADFGIPYPRAFIFVARDPVTVTLHLRARRR